MHVNSLGLMKHDYQQGRYVIPYHDPGDHRMDKVVRLDKEVCETILRLLFPVAVKA